MLAFPSMLVSAAENAGMTVPPDPDVFDADAFPHFQVFCLTQLCRSCEPGEHWDNAKVIASIEDIKSATLMDLIAAGLRWRS
jgi:hypothetical protein